MGYYTVYELASSDNDIMEEVKEKIVKMYGRSPFEDECKWYEHDEHMLEISKQYPNVVFELYGEGEEAGDLWKKYYKNGKRQYCPAEVSFPEFDESKLE